VLISLKQSQTCEFASPAGVMASANGSVSSRGECSYQLEKINAKLRNGLNEVVSMGDCQKQLSEHLAEMSNLNREVARWSADVSTLLSDFEKDIKCISSYYQRILSSTKALVSYGSDVNVIPEIIELLNKRHFSKAKTEVTSFLECLMKLIRVVEKDVQTLDDKCPVKIEEVSQQIKEMIRDLDMPLISEAVKRGEAKVQASTVRLFKAGIKTGFFLVGGVAMGFFLASNLPEEMSEYTQLVASTGSNIFTYYSMSAIKSLGEILNATKLTEKTKKGIESIVSKVYHCLRLFVAQLNEFQNDIESIKVHIDWFKDDAASLDDESVEGTTSTNSVRHYVKNILQKMYDDFCLLKGEVVDNNRTSNLEKESEMAMKEISKMHPS